MTKPRLTIVTATAGAEKAEACFQSWYLHAGMDRAVVVVQQNVSVRDLVEPALRSNDIGVSLTTPDYLGPVPAFRLGVDLALQITAPDGIIACLHDDLLIEEQNWDAKVMAFFNLHPEVGLIGFGGGTGLGSDDIYKAPYNPHQLARQDFVSNMREAEAHGRRATLPVRVACLDGFSQIGRVAYLRGFNRSDYGEFLRSHNDPLAEFRRSNIFGELCASGVIHHAYDAYLGAQAISRGWQVYMLPIACHHYGGQTAVGDAGYNEWAKQQEMRLDGTREGDAGFWKHSHHVVYGLLRGILPIRV